jgi:hypothetical protein
MGRVGRDGRCCEQEHMLEKPLLNGPTKEENRRIEVFARSMSTGKKIFVCTLTSRIHKEDSSALFSNVWFIFSRCCCDLVFLKKKEMHIAGVVSVRC